MAKTDWQKHLCEQPNSGMSIPQYCAAHGLHSADFYKRRKILRNQSEDFASLAIKADKSCPYLDLRVELAGDVLRFQGSSNHSGFLSALIAGVKP